MRVENLRVRYGGTQVLDGVDVSVAAGEIVGIVGESGSGKSTLLNAIAGLLPRTANVCSGTILYDERDIGCAGERAMRSLRGGGIGYLFQNAEASLDPLFTVGSQFDEVLRAHGIAAGNASEARAIQRSALERVGLEQADTILRSLPSELSGGMCQRVTLAIALATKPKILLADEVTSALDVTSQKTVMDILCSLNAEDGLSILLVSHDIDLVASLAHRIIVMREGRIVESGRSGAVVKAPRHPYTRELIAAIPRAAGSIEAIELGGSRAS